MTELKPPKLTFPPEVAKWVETHYDAARVILEYGSGGSTVLAGEKLGCRVFSVESDKDWAQDLERWFDANPPLADVRLHHADIGPTKAWGNPVNEKNWRKFSHYPIGIWDRKDFAQPDVVLIDGRFRAACFLAVLIRTKAPVTVLFDDYKDRAGYHVVEDFVKPVEMRGGMAKFELEPTPFPVDEIGKIFDIFGRIL